MRTRTIVVACGVAVLVAACELPPRGPDLDVGPAADVDCSACHDLEALAAPISAAAPRDWMAAAGAGVVRDPAVVTADAEVAYTFGWVPRGHHESSDAPPCVECHAVHGRTSGHGSSSYPPAGQADAFRPAVDCAASCHQWWLPPFADVRSANGAGFTGSLRPADLLASDLDAGGSHGRIWREGLALTEDSAGSGLRVDLLETGCGGCHNRFSERHGSICSCTACHDLDADSVGGSHEAHVNRIEERYPDGVPASDGQACTLCHCRGEQPDELCRAACYNCHLSGHGPSPVLW